MNITSLEDLLFRHTDPKSRLRRGARRAVCGAHAALGVLDALERRIVWHLPASFAWRMQHRYAWHRKHHFSGPLYAATRRHRTDTPQPRAQLPILAVLARPGTAHFLDPVLAALSEWLEILVYPAYAPGLVTQLEHVDVIWLEWGTSAFWLSELARVPAATRPRILCRVHDHELAFRWLPYANWDVADDIVFVNQSALEDFDARTRGKWRQKLRYMPNAVDERSVPLGTGGNLNRVLMLSEGYTPRKDYLRAINLFARALAMAPRLELLIRADPTMGSDHYEQVMRLVDQLGIGGAVRMEAPAGDPKTRKRLLGSKRDILDTYHGAAAILSTSRHEAFHYAIAEGMLAGLHPIIYPWEWGSPRELWGSYVATDESDFVRRLVHWSHEPPEKKERLGREARTYVISNYGNEVTRTRWRTQGLPLAHTVRPPRFLLFAHHHPFMWNPHGGEKSMARIVHHLAAQGWDPLVLVCNRKTRFVGRQEVEGVPVLVVRPDEYRVAASDVLSWWRPNVALMWGLPARQTWDLCAGRGIPYLLFIRYWHLLNPPPYIDLLTDPIDPNHHAEHHGLFGHAANVVVNAEHVARVVQRIHGVSSSVSYVPVDPLPRRSPASAKRYVTVINARKGGGGKLVAHLARVNPDVQFLLIDRDDTDYPSNVHTRSYDDRPYNVMLDDTKVLLFPFDEEPCGTGRVVLEAYHLGVPVLAPRRGGIPEVVPNPHLIDESNDLTAWSTALRALLADYDRATSLVTQQAQLFGPSEQLEVITELVSHFHNGFKS